MRLLFIGDIVGRSGRDAVETQLKKLRDELNVDCVIANGENAASGNGLTDKIAKQLFDCGVDGITMGNHLWNQKQLVSYIEQEKRLIRPLNHPSDTPGRGYTIVTGRNNEKVLIINVLGRVFMDPADDPFAAVNSTLQHYKLGRDVQAIIVDMHAEATSEKQAMGFHCDGRVSLVVGTHTHVPTADHRILPNGTAYISDVGMTGDYNSILGVEKTIPMLKFTRKIPTERMQQAEDPATICGVVVETDSKSGLAKSIQPIRVGPILEGTK